jgi:hypothetical protein
MTADTSELDAIQKNFSASMPKALGPDVRCEVLRLQDRIVGRAKTGLELMLAAVGVVMFIGCVNITNLLSTRTAEEVRASEN